MMLARLVGKPLSNVQMCVIMYMLFVIEFTTLAQTGLAKSSLCMLEIEFHVINVYLT